MTPHEIRPKQLRALLLLLVLVPLIPTALMIRFMVDTLKVQRQDVLDRLEQSCTENLRAFVRYTPSAGETMTAAEQAENLLHRLRLSLDENVTSRIVAADGKPLAGESAPFGQPLALAAAPGIPEATIQVHLASPKVLDRLTAEARRFLIWTGALTTLAVLLIASLAALALHRQLALNELKNTSVATVAHELRTPLASMRMLVDTLRERRYRDEHQLHEYLELVTAENERLSRLAENFLTFSRLDRGTQPLQLAAVAPSAVAEQAVAPLRGRLEASGCAFSLAVPDNLPLIQADRDALTQVLTNLLDNALKYTDAEKRITLRAHADGRRVVFTVEDNGPGVSTAERQSIFRPFYQVDQKLSRTREGCGLGLAIARRIVEAHGGEITVAGEPGRGSTFTVSIPIA